MFLNAKLFPNVPRYQTTSVFLNVDVPELPVHQHNLYFPEFQCDVFLNLKVISKILNVPEFSCTSAQLPCFKMSVMQMLLKMKMTLMLLTVPEYQCF